jgi:hypothetical protein
MFSVETTVACGYNGKMALLRMLLYNNDIDLGDAWMIFAAHFRTWDFRNGATLRELEKDDFNGFKQLLPEGTDLQARKTQAVVRPTQGTSGDSSAGLLYSGLLRFLGTHCLTSTNIAASKIVAVTIRWDNGMGFTPNNVNIPEIVDRHRGCDTDTRCTTG